MDKKTKNGVITVAVLAIVGLVAYRMLSGKPSFNQGNTGGGDNGGGQGGNNGGGGGGTTSGLNFTSLANDLYAAMDGYGTAWDNGPSNGVSGIMKLIKSNADFDALSAAYGTRTLNCGSFNPFCDDFTGNMVQSLNEELDSSEITEVNQILASNGVTRKI